jgi:hypothetical protein
MVWPKQKVAEFLHRIAKGALEERRIATHHAMGCLQNQLHRAQLIARPFFPDV